MGVEGAYKTECKKHSVLSAKLKEIEEFLYLLPAYGGRRSTIMQLTLFVATYAVRVLLSVSDGLTF